MQETAWSGAEGGELRDGVVRGRRQPEREREDEHEPEREAGALVWELQARLLVLEGAPFAYPCPR